MTERRARDIDAEAARYVARMDGSAWDEADEHELEAWLARDARHAGALLSAQAAWMTLDGLARPARSTEAAARAGWRPSRRHLLAAGGTAVAASIAGGFFLFGQGTSYSTAVGEIRRVPLADGSTAAINTASVVAIAFTPDVRNVRIERGEAWFQVAKDASRPFIVEAGRVRVRAIGTAFSVRRRDDGADILVSEGVVEAWAAGAAGHRVRLEAGGRAFVADNAAIERAPAAASAVDRTLAWRSGKIDLAGDRLDSAAAEFNRYNVRQLVILDPVVGRERLDGVFRTDDPEGFALAVRESLGAPVDLSDPHAIRIGSAGSR